MPTSVRLPARTNITSTSSPPTIDLIEARHQHFDLLRQSTLMTLVTEQSTQLRIVQPKAAQMAMKNEALAKA